ncbi:SDR family oxidoreductase [Micromonospora fluostatini]|uniref:SDR family oxidoreductase n=1 Tax=Micromonospora fluostatini TaxID=1629071 RepID=A0ABY2DP02_9ACTN|nr:SDR family oxidoreductase [Micromonospora fluostatini]
MRIVVVGGTGLVGRKLVDQLRQRGHDAVPASPGTGVDTLTGEGLAEALTGARVVVDVTNSPSFEAVAALDFFRTSTRNLLDAEATAGVDHHLALSVVGADRMPDSGYMPAKAAQETLIESAGRPYTILRATQFHEFVGAIVAAGAEGDTVHLSPAPIQPVAADEVAATLADLATGEPVNGIVELAGPEAFPLTGLAERILAAQGDPRTVVADPEAAYFGQRLTAGTLLPSGAHPRLATTGFEEWLSRAG